MDPKPLISLIIPTHNRCRILAAGLQRILALPYHPKEVIVVDNASTDRTAEVIPGRFPEVKFFKLGRNNPTAARNLGAREARGEFLVMLDDDSYPLPGGLSVMLRAFAEDPRLAAAGFRIQSPAGVEEPVARHDVFIGCGVGYRHKAFLDSGGYPEDFGYYAEEYAVALALCDLGYRVRCLREAVVVHLRAAQGRSKNRIFYRLIRNNALLNARHFPFKDALLLTAENIERYLLIAQKERALPGFALGLATIPGMFLRGLRTRQLLSSETLDTFRMHEALTQMLAERFRRGARIAYWELGRQVRSFISAARQTGLNIEAIYDDRFHRYRRRIARVPVLPGEHVNLSRADALVLTTTSPGGVAFARQQLTELRVRVPVVSLVGSDTD